MASTYSDRLRLEKQADGENPNSWGQILNDNVIELIDEAVASYTVVSVSSAGVTLSEANGTTDQSRSAALEFAGTLTANVTITIPAEEKLYFVRENTTGSFAVTMKTPSGTALAVTQQSNIYVACDGTNLHAITAPLSVDDFTINELTVVSAATINGSFTAQQVSSTGLTTGVVSATSAILNSVEASVATFGSRITTSIVSATSAIFTGTVCATTLDATTGSFSGTVSATTVNLTNLNIIPSGTYMLFQQTAAPTGWTKATTHNNKALRVVSGTASSGGSVAFTTAFASQAVAGTNASSTVTTNSTNTGYANAPLVNHTHFLIAAADVGQSDQNYVTSSEQIPRKGDWGSTNNYQIKGTSTAATLGKSSQAGSSSNGSHRHSIPALSGTAAGQTFTGTAINLAVQYVDIIIASKD